MTAIVWCDPPASEDVKRTWAYRLQPLLDRPGDWALVETYSRKQQAVGAVRELRRGAAGHRRDHGIKSVPPGRWEFRQGRVEESGRWGVWARYLGPVEASKGAR